MIDVARDPRRAVPRGARLRPRRRRHCHSRRCSSGSGAGCPASTSRPTAASRARRSRSPRTSASSRRLVRESGADDRAWRSIPTSTGWRWSTRHGTADRRGLHAGVRGARGAGRRGAAERASGRAQPVVVVNLSTSPGGRGRRAGGRGPVRPGAGGRGQRGPGHSRRGGRDRRRRQRRGHPARASHRAGRAPGGGLDLATTWRRLGQRSLALVAASPAVHDREGERSRAERTCDRCTIGFGSGFPDASVGRAGRAAARVAGSLGSCAAVRHRADRPAASPRRRPAADAEASGGSRPRDSCTEGFSRDVWNRRIRRTPAGRRSAARGAAAAWSTAATTPPGSRSSTATGLEIVKAAGKLSDARAAAGRRPTPTGTVGIGHTRWATHGAPTTPNAHPHTDQSGRIALIHNGIIENAGAHPEGARARAGHTFKSETDTEVLAHLIGEFYQGNLEEARRRGAARRRRRLRHRGRSRADEPDVLVAARKGSPLLVGVGEGECFVASDASALLEHTRSVVYLDDGEMVVLTRDGYRVRNLDDDARSTSRSTRSSGTWRRSSGAASTTSC